MNKIFFLHFMKSGGTTLHSEFESLFTGGVCDKRESFKTALTSSHYQYSQLISGHFSLLEARRAREEFGYFCVTTLRDPVDRIISMYNFLRSHNPETHPEIVDKSHPLIQEITEANAKSADEFFSGSIARGSLFFNNYYTNLLLDGQTSFLGNVAPRAKNTKDVEDAINNLRTFDLCSLTDDTLPLVNTLRNKMNFNPVSRIEKIKVTKDEMTWHQWMRPVRLMSREELPITANPLIDLDMRLFNRFRNGPE